MEGKKNGEINTANGVTATQFYS